MNIKNIIAALATTITVATTTAAMADVRISGGAEVTVQGGVTIRDHRTEQPAKPVYLPAPVIVKPIAQPIRQPVRQPVIVRDHRAPNRWETQYQEPVVYQPAPVVVTQQPPVITCNENAWTNIAQANVTGTRTQWSSDTISLGGYRNIGELTFGYVYGNQSIEDVTVNYANGTQAKFHLGDTVNESQTHQTTRTLALNPRLAVSNIQVSGFGGQIGMFKILAKA